MTDLVPALGPLLAKHGSSLDPQSAGRFTSRTLDDFVQEAYRVVLLCRLLITYFNDSDKA